jgi:DNA-binding XRE family transcriptional regulator
MQPSAQTRVPAYSPDMVKQVNKREAQASSKAFRKTLGRRIAGWRKLTGVSQDKLSKAAGVHNATIASLESGRMPPSLEMLEIISTALEIPLGQMMFQDAPPPPEKE